LNSQQSVANCQVYVSSSFARSLQFLPSSRHKLATFVQNFVHCSLWVAQGYIFLNKERVGWTIALLEEGLSLAWPPLTPKN